MENNLVVDFLQQALVGEGLDEEQLFSSGGGSMRDGVSSELDGYLQKLKVLKSFALSGRERSISLEFGFKYIKSPYILQTFFKSTPL